MWLRNHEHEALSLNSRRSQVGPTTNGISGSDGQIMAATSMYLEPYRHVGKIRCQHTSTISVLALPNYFYNELIRVESI